MGSSTQPSSADNSLYITDITEDMLDEICAIENICQEDPWSKNNFLDALRTGYHMQALLTHQDGQIIGYYIAMKGIDEAHLLNINIAPANQKLGYAHYLLELMRLWAIAEKMQWIWLEVRKSNARAIHLYEQFGFYHAGTRKNYYALKNGEREDAILMSLPLPC